MLRTEIVIVATTLVAEVHHVMLVEDFCVDVVKGAGGPILEDPLIPFPSVYLFRLVYCQWGATKFLARVHKCDHKQR